jgi:hypothetical protein
MIQQQYHFQNTIFVNVSHVCYDFIKNSAEIDMKNIFL